MLSPSGSLQDAHKEPVTLWAGLGTIVRQFYNDTSVEAAQSTCLLAGIAGRMAGD